MNSRELLILADLFQLELELDLCTYPKSSSIGAYHRTHLGQTEFYSVLFKQTVICYLVQNDNGSPSTVRYMVSHIFILVRALHFMS